MRNWTPLIIVLTIVLAATSIAIVSKQNNLSKTQTTYIGRNNRVSDKPQIPVELILTTDQISYTAQSEIIYTLKAEVGINYVAAIETVLNFDPNLLEVDEIIPGELFVNPNIIRNNIDKKNGVIEYTIGSLKPKIGGGEILTIKTKLKTNSRDANILQFNKEKTRISLIDENFSPVGEYGVNIKFTENSFTILP